METDLLSTEEVGAILKVSKITVQKWCHERKIPAAKAWPGPGIGKAYRIKKTDLGRWYEGKFLESTVFQ
ncbi:MAG TPA: hypothetical protein DCY61_00045 [Dehalococcoidia bacterium]|nr:hypothetical protein [Dehalococcoidia bacterium]